jgi:hypothetical protein
MTVVKNIIPKIMFEQTDIRGRERKVKVKVKLSLCLTKHHAMKAYWGSGCIAPLIF